MYSREVLETIFTYHPVEDSVQEINYKELRQAALVFAETLIECTPICADQTVAIRKLRECVMTANAAIALRGVS